MRDKFFSYVAVFTVLFTVLAVFPASTQAAFLSDMWQSVTNYLPLLKDSAKEAERGETATTTTAVDQPLAEQGKTTAILAQKAPVTDLYRPALEYENAVVSAVDRTEKAVVSIVVTKDLPII